MADAQKDQADDNGLRLVVTATMFSDRPNSGQQPAGMPAIVVSKMRVRTY